MTPAATAQDPAGAEAAPADYGLFGLPRWARRLYGAPAAPRRRPATIEPAWRRRSPR
jgi:hypothetical protein